MRLGAWIAALALLFVPTGALTAELPDPLPGILQHELQQSLPTMWKVKAIDIQDAFVRPDIAPSLWKARFRAQIETSEPTYVPTDRNVGAITVVQAAYPAGVVRQLSGRFDASHLNDGWDVRFDLDNRPTMTAGLPLRYFTGRVVVEGSDEHIGLVEREHGAAIAAAIEQHQAAMASMRTVHEAELEALRAALKAADDLTTAREEIEQRLGALKLATASFDHGIDTLATSSAAQGLMISQWAERGFDSTLTSRRGSSAAELVGAPDVGQCDPKRRTQLAWFVGAHETGEQSVTVSFLQPVIPTELVVYETASTGFVKRLVFDGDDGAQKAVEKVVDLVKGCASEAVFPVVGITFPVRSVTLMVDADLAGNKAIDAVMLKGVKALE